MKKAVGTIAVLSLCLSIAGCATGPKFAGPENPPADKSRVYVYRPSKLIGGANVHRVFVDQSKEPRSLPNGSWIKLDLAPGTHSISVEDYFGTMKCGTAMVKVAPGQVAYVADGVNTTQGLNRLYVGCSAVVQTEDLAKPDIAGLNEKTQD